MSRETETHATVHPERAVRKRARSSKCSESWSPSSNSGVTFPGLAAWA